MAPLSERQIRARDLADWLGGMAGVWVVSPLPLDDGAKALRFQVLAVNAIRLLKNFARLAGYRA
jgi:hypothetical protein